VRSDQFSNLYRSSILVGAALAGVLGTAVNVTAQALKDVQTPDTPLVLKAQGSFFVGGEKAEQTQGELGDLGPGGHITVNQMYVRYMVPQGGDGNVPVVMVHGATLTGKSWETTPDGRMGWDEYFVRKGHPVYVPDQVGRGRSGFNQAAFNNVRAGSTPPGNLPRWIRFSDEVVWPNFRFGSKPGAPYEDSQFPVTAVDELSKQGVPDVSFGGVPTPNPTLKALSDLASQVNGAVLMGHSQSGAFPRPSSRHHSGLVHWQSRRFARRQKVDVEQQAETDRDWNQSHQIRRFDAPCVHRLDEGHHRDADGQRDDSGELAGLESTAHGVPLVLLQCLEQ
jgi:hypothetical protein